MTIRRILHIDDDEDDQEIFSSALLQAAPDVELVSLDNARVALQQLTEKLLQPDMVFLDLNMPDMNGQEFLLEIKNREALKHIPIIVLSTSSHAGTIELTRELGASEFYSKPEAFDHMVSILQEVLQKTN